MPSLFQVKTFLRYWLDAVDAHSLHSPFLFDFYNEVVKQKGDKTRFQEIEQTRKMLLADPTEIPVVDYGSGSLINSGATRKISEIARHSLSTPFYSSIYARIIKHYRCRNIIELGTSLGINTLYLASEKGTNVTTFEGSGETVKKAQAVFSSLKADNIKIIEGNIDVTLPNFLLKSPKPDFVFLDANHRYEATLRYFHQLVNRFTPASIMVIDDIHYHEGMEKGWNAMKSHPLVYASADLYRCGILFFDPSLNKQHVVLQV